MSSLACLEIRSRNEEATNCTCCVFFGIITFYLFLNCFSMGVSDDLKYVCCHRLYACINTQKLKGLDSREITSLPEIKKVIYMASHFNHRRKWTVCSSQEPFAYNESFLSSRHDSYSQFPWSLLGTLGTMTPFCVLNTKINALQIRSLADYANETTNVYVVVNFLL